jgi:acyl-coenzyme A thioesterase PaaI-like protein
MQIAIQAQHGERYHNYLIPPPVFQTFQGKFLEFDPLSSSLYAQFPVLGQYLNPFGNLQGGITTALVDNTIGPLSFLIAPPNITHRLNMKFIRPITLEMGYIQIKCQLVSRKGLRLIFKAEVTDPKQVVVAKGKSTHWIIK